MDNFYFIYVLLTMKTFVLLCYCIICVIYFNLSQCADIFLGKNYG